MKVIKAELKFLRISPQKAQIVARELKGKNAKEAEAILSFLGKKTAHSLAKLLKSAVANAEHNLGLKEENLEIQKIEVLKGPVLKRWRPRSRGMANRIAKKTTHLKLFLVNTLEEEEKNGKEKKKLKPGTKKITGQKKESKGLGKLVKKGSKKDSSKQEKEEKES